MVELLSRSLVPSAGVSTSSPKKNTSATLSATYGGTTKTVTIKITRR
jgi:hypothetical protein